MRAEDRYSWLDEEAAERLLRGRPSDGPPHPDSASLKALAETLDELVALRTAAAVTTGHPFTAGFTTDSAPGGPDARGDRELPGEAAALAAFRMARDARVSARTAAGPRHHRYRRLPRMGVFGRPLRAGVAAAVLGGVLGGVAVATGTGVLPAPFRGTDGSPAPGSTLSSGPEGKDSPAPGSAGTGTPSGGHRQDGRPGGTERGGPGGPGAPGDGDPVGAESRGPGDPTADPDGPDGPAVSRTRAVVLCGGYRKAELGSDERAELERAAGGPERIGDFCRARSGPPSGGSGVPDGGSGSGDPGNGDPGNGEPGSGGGNPGNGNGGSAGPAAGGDGTEGGDGIEGGDWLPEEEGEGGDWLPEEPEEPGPEGGGAFPATEPATGSTGGGTGGPDGGETPYAPAVPAP